LARSIRLSARVMDHGMIEILPNWHPIFVHFTVALYTTSALLFFAGFAFSRRSWSGTCLTVARWNLWLGAGFTVATVAAGLYAFSTVKHDEPSHAAMTDHRNWALVTVTVWWMLALWLAWIYRRGRKVRRAFIVLLAVAAALLGTTAFKGGELVYRHGLGVLSLPQPAEDGEDKGAENGGDHDH
jgi:uncharacterized membrane protein